MLFRWGSKSQTFTFLSYPPLICLDCTCLLVCLQEDVCPEQLFRQGEQTWTRQRFEALRGFSPKSISLVLKKHHQHRETVKTGSTNNFCLQCFEIKKKMNLALLPPNSVPCYNNRRQNSLFKFSQWVFELMKQESYCSCWVPPHQTARRSLEIRKMFLMTEI